MPPRKAAGPIASLDDLRVSIISGRTTERSNALKELIEFASRAERIKPLKDKSIHQLLEALFHCAVAEKSTYYGGTKTTRAQAENKLGLCAEALRMIITQRTAKIKVKAARAVVDHITESLPGPDQDFVPPLQQDYIKALVALLGNPATVEHLCRNDADSWLACVDFLTESLSRLLDNGDREFVVLSRGSPVPGTVTGTSSTNRSNSFFSQRHGSQKNLRLLEDMVLCLHQLVSATNAPLALRYKQITRRLVQILQLRGLNVSNMHQATLGALVGIVAQIQADDLSMAASVTRELLPLLSHWWQPHSSKNDKLLNSVRDEILRAVFILLPHMDAILRAADDGPLLDEILELMDALWLEYSRRDDRLHLQLTDLDFSSLKVDYFKTEIFGLRPFDMSSERKWAILEAMAQLELLYSRKVRQQRCPPADPDQDQPRKRRRVECGQDRIHQKLNSPDDGLKLVALQLLSFTFKNERPSQENYFSDMNDIVRLLSHKQSTIASWAMIACASYSLHPQAKATDISALWSQAWQVAVRSVSHQGTSRAASFLLYSILKSDILALHETADSITTMVTAADISGPAVVADSSLILMLHLLHLRNTMLPGAGQITCNHVIRWVFSKWNPSDGAYAMSNSTFTSVIDLANLLRACCGSQNVPEKPLIPVPGGPVYQYWSQQRNDHDLMRYLLLSESTSTCDRSESPKSQAYTSDSEEARHVTDAADANAARKLIAELLHPKLSDSVTMSESWAQSKAKVSTDRLRSVLQCALSSLVIIPELNQMKISLSQEVETSTQTLVEILLDLIMTADDTQDFSDMCFQSITGLLPRFCSQDIIRFRQENQPLLAFFVKLASMLDEKSSQPKSSSGVDLMDLDDEFESQQSQTSLISKAVSFPRSELGLEYSHEGFHWDIKMRLRLLSFFLDDEEHIGILPTDFVGTLVQLSEEEFLYSTRLLKECLRSDFTVRTADASRIIETVGSVIGEDNAACEVVLVVCIDMIELLIPVWSDDQELSGPIGDLYLFLVDKGSPGNNLSQRAQARLADLLLTLLEKKPDYGTSLNYKSCRSSLFSLIKEGALWLKFNIGSKLPKIFELYVFKVHDELFLDILDCLPTDSDHREGIAFRLYLLAEIARQWPTTLRRGIYTIFETSGHILTSVYHAQRCLSSVAEYLDLESPKELFRLFTPQLLYTWLESSALETIPYGIFGFSSLEELLKQAKSEAISLMMMRGQEDQAENLAQTLRTTTAKLIQENFARAIAYSVAHDICGQKNASRDKHVTSESIVKRIMGKESFYQHVNLEFVDIIGILFDIIDQEDPIEAKCFAKNPSLKYAADISAKIKGFGHSEVILPPNQQPLFRARHLTQELEHICGRTQHELQSLWSPALVVSVCRKLLNTIQAAMGPLHACAVIRKVRILVCLAGDHAVSLYPLEMILHSIRPYIGDPECADDALGITRYLILSGANHLARVPAFLAGYALSTLASLRLFLESSQSSTTQESQFKATKSNAQTFHKWFTDYLTSYESSGFRNESQRQAFRKITQAAAQIGTSGNAEKETHESSLLLEILKDGANRHRLLNQSSRDLALAMLCGDFKPPPPGPKDVIDTDDGAIKHSTMVWESCKAQSLHANYLTWAGRVVGKSFAASGEVQEKLLRESRLADYARLAGRDLGSEEGILEAIEALITDRDCATAGLAEAALRKIVTETTAAQDNSLSMACQHSLSEAVHASSDWAPYSIPPSDYVEVSQMKDAELFSRGRIDALDWSQSMAVFLAKSVPSYTILAQLPPLLLKSKSFADRVFPFIVHLVLFLQLDTQQTVRRKLSDSLKEWLVMDTPVARENIKLLINTVLFLRTQPLPSETSIADRSTWLEIDLAALSTASTRCGMYKVALVFAEIAFSEASQKTSRRSSAARDLDTTDSTEILLEIFENIDDPDAYYGLPQISNLDNVLSRLEYEKDGMKSLAFRGAQLDDHVRRRDSSATKDGQSMVRTLGELGLSGLAHSLLQTQQGLDGQSSSIGSTFETARRLAIWNLPVPPNQDHRAVTMYKAYQSIHQATDLISAQQAVHQGLSSTIRYLTGSSLKAFHLRQHLGALAALTEIDESLTIQGSVDGLCRRFEGRSEWMMSGRYDDVRQILSCRESTLGLLSQHSHFQKSQKLTAAMTRTLEVQALLLSAGIFRYHDATQESLNISTSLNNLIQPCEAMGLNVDAAIKVEVANSFWDYGEMIPSIRMLQSIEGECALKKQTIDVNRADLLASIGHQVSVAKLESSEEIQRKYLQPALKELRGNNEGKAAGKVYHQFAVFCDEQLQNPDSLADLNRLKGLEKGKSDEVTQLSAIVSKTKDQMLKQRYTGMLNKARTWLDLDRQELRRIEQTRSQFLQLSLENYLLALSASDEHHDDALRFTALWLERSEEQATTQAVQTHLHKVPSRKFAPLINQLTSRLQEAETSFHKLLQNLVFRICCEHPYHGMYQIWSGMKSKINKDDEIAVLRSKAMVRISEHLGKHKKVYSIWQAVNYTNAKYYALAIDRGPEKGYKQGQKVAIHNHAQAKPLQDSLFKYRIPPPTMQMELRADCDYSTVPVIAKLEPEMSIASGLSAPKILTAVGSDGVRYKQLVKGGNDDLRQDAIMEQVFAAVSSVLKLHRTTRQRNLGIRTYKVVPLTTSTGLIEFVPNTIPLHDYLIPAHERYYPKLWRGSQCRKEISNAQGKPVEERIRAYRKATERFPPVMRYFFMEHFPDPDEWFVRRLAYTRTTAAISMLGHVLGLGDRHGHNILLDSRTGEVVHIDLGIAFEMGRILPVPELVPFRLTRDIVDGMGITKTEGVFRRCCEFTMDALREETYSIMTILDVLRYDPLYSWSISPVRLAKLQDTTTSRDNETGAPGVDVKAVVENRKVVNEPSEAERALEVVRKKLSKTLSVTATVNDLINQATSERNLACLFSGWAAYA
ncbi:hypothetical protein MGG_14764 [Pyricularia oryzae 70-15]|uniref:Serine/threonine-protein kinase Tel1 n=2 Tax=Pyricularia oryzae TaxID=318829 RepID=G4MVM3_PYRO7|nr:uncharacterized protein MGG_14764 [Pyricularia oryzae 70-15]EHA54132.1 hypothetical protein MGG_14764 [Pyricularia oryzae 70-15]ELQ42027.1 hypothetical protein OOU_Y34scaffold00240g34 [Pyricularia oryzae Y34]KAI7930896.1 hypothetical protein M9X92_000576 [Pyricularia oryzae]KAI7932382.1 hypothetical protein M0657_000512 [Pyricularia oryzae]